MPTMSLAHTRRKQPEQVRRAILDCANRLIAERGAAELSIQAVADAAGVSKGGVFHHFPNRQALIFAMLQDLLEQSSDQIDALMAADPVPHGRFTRAYVQMILMDDDPDQIRACTALMQVTLFDPETCILWTNWLNSRLAEHAATDGDPALELVRLAADGTWLTARTQDILPDNDAPTMLRNRLPALLDRLTAMTYPAPAAKSPVLADRA